MNTSSENNGKQVVVVTGAAKGIGLGIATEFGLRGDVVALFDVDRDALSEATAMLTARDISVTGMVVDVTSNESVTEAIDSIVEKFGRIDVLVNNAGLTRDKRITRMTEDDWDLVLNVNLKSQFLCCKAALKHMTAAGYGRIINISSRAWLGGVGQVNYSAAKGGVISLTRSLALEWAKAGVTVNAIAPGIVDTPLFRSYEEAIQERLKQSVPVQRIGTAVDIAQAVIFFAQRESSYVTGQTLYVCGGRSLASPSV